MEDDPLYQLVKEQLARIQDQFNARAAHIEEKLDFQTQLAQERISSLQESNKSLHSDLRDHETRIRTLTDSATAARTWQSLFSGVGFLTGVAALIRAFFGS